MTTTTVTAPKVRRQISDTARLCLILAVLIVVLGITAPHFLSATNVLNIGRSVAIMGTAATGVTVAILSGSVDLAFPAVISVGTAMLAELLSHGISVAPALVLTLGVCAAIGAINGVLAVWLRIEVLIVTLATYTITVSILVVLTSGATIPAANDFLAALGRDQLGAVPVSLLILVLCAIVLSAWLRYSVTGQRLYAVGDNREAARLSGIHVSLLRILALAVSGLLAGFAAVILNGATGFATTNNGDIYLLPVLSAVVLGGASLNGGRGSIASTFVGVLIIGSLANGMAILGYGPFVQQIVQGCVLVVAMIVYSRRRALP